MAQQLLDRKEIKLRREAGIEQAKKDGKYTSRKKIAVDSKLLHQIASDFDAHKISEAEAMKRLGISSRSTFYRRLRELRQ